MRLFGYPYNDLVICKDSPDYLGCPYNIYTREYLKPVSQMIKRDLSDSL